MCRFSQSADPRFASLSSVAGRWTRHGHRRQLFVRLPASVRPLALYLTGHPPQLLSHTERHARQPSAWLDAALRRERPGRRRRAPRRVERARVDRRLPAARAGIWCELVLPSIAWQRDADGLISRSLLLTSGQVLFHVPSRDRPPCKYIRVRCKNASQLTLACTRRRIRSPSASLPSLPSSSSTGPSGAPSRPTRSPCLAPLARSSARCYSSIWSPSSCGRGSAGQ
jgi:hypothetical protein